MVLVISTRKSSIFLGSSQEEDERRLDRIPNRIPSLSRRFGLNILSKAEVSRFCKAPNHILIVESRHIRAEDNIRGKRGHVCSWLIHEVLMWMTLASSAALTFSVETSAGVGDLEIF